MNRLVKIGTAAFFLLSSGSAFAAPSLQGSTGLINTQTADVLRGGQFSVGVDHVREGTTENIVFGVGTQTEVGVNLIRHRGDSQQSLLNAKLALVPEQILIPGLSVGVEDALNRSQRTEYAVISKTLPWGIRLHVGGGNGRYHGAFGGVEKSLNPLVTMIAEYDGNTVNYGTRLTISPGLKLEGGFRSHHAYYGLNFTM